MRILKYFKPNEYIPENARCVGVTTITKEVIDLQSRSGKTTTICVPVGIYEIEEDVKES